MHLIKLNATESTNTFLKDYSRKNAAESFTVVWAMSQTNGRGQMQNSWHSESGKNLTFSVLVKCVSLPIQHQFYISKVVSLAIRSTLVKFLPNKITVKWPNDIMAENKKIAGILIENRVQKGVVTDIIVGIGLNINQDKFPVDMNAVSMKNLSNSFWDLEMVLNALVKSIKTHIGILDKKLFHDLNANYLTNLYRFKQPSMFFKEVNQRFMGKIVGVTSSGKLQLELEDESIEDFDLKEVRFI